MGQLEEVYLDDALKENYIVFRGDPGAGKNTLLRHIAYTYSTKGDDKRRIPIFIRLADLSTGRFGFDLDKWLEHNYPRQWELIKKKTLNGGCLVMLDGLDEVRRENDNWESAKSEAERLADFGNQVILSCRSAAYSDGFMPARFRVFEVCEFSEPQQEEFLNNWFKKESRKASDLLDALKDNPRMRQFTENPLMLSLTAFVCGGGECIDLPMQRAELYERATEQLMVKWNEKRAPGKKPIFEKGDKRNFLEETALDYFIQGMELFGEQELLDRIRCWKKKGFFPEGNREEVLEELSQHNGFLARYTDDRYRFLHLTLQEYFTACAIHKSGKWRDYIEEKYVWHPRWEEVIRLLGSMMDDASEFIEFIWRPGTEDDIFQSRLLLAGRCLGDVKQAGKLWVNIAKRIHDLYHQTDSYSHRTAIAEAYSLLTHRYPDALELFLADLKDQDSYVRGLAAEALGQIGSERAVDKLMAVMKDKDQDSGMHWRAAEALYKISKPPERVIFSDGVRDF
jgi:predicted NACHT family NTPase